MAFESCVQTGIDPNHENVKIIFDEIREQLLGNLLFRHAIEPQMLLARLIRFQVEHFLLQSEVITFEVYVEILVDYKPILIIGIKVVKPRVGPRLGRPVVRFKRN